MVQNDSTAPYAVIGATGQQGGAVVDALLSWGVPIRALVRDPDSSRSTALAARGVELVRADQEAPESVERALSGVAGLFFHTTFSGEDGTEGEVRRGVRVAEAAAAAQVPQVVYSSVGGAERGTGVPHFESKGQVERRLAELLPARFVRPAFFMENLASQLRPDDGRIVLRLPMPGDVPVQMVAVRDIGRATARLLLDASAVDGDAIEIAGDEKSMTEAAADVERVLGVPARYEALPLDVLGEDQDLRAMFRWFSARPAYEADFPATRRLVPDVLDLPAWIAVQAGGAVR